MCYVSGKMSDFLTSKNLQKLTMLMFACPGRKELGNILRVYLLII